MITIRDEKSNVWTSYFSIDADGKIMRFIAEGETRRDAAQNLIDMVAERFKKNEKTD